MGGKKRRAESLSVIYVKVVVKGKGRDWDVDGRPIHD